MTWVRLDTLDLTVKRAIIETLSFTVAVSFGINIGSGPEATGTADVPSTIWLIPSHFIFKQNTECEEYVDKHYPDHLCHKLHPAFFK